MYILVEEFPYFPNLNDYISTHIKYPKNALLKNISGTVLVSFIVSEKGKLKNIHIKTSVHKDLDKEAMRVLKGMPKWRPGRNNGRPIDKEYELPIIFSIVSKANLKFIY